MSTGWMSTGWMSTASRSSALLDSSSSALRRALDMRFVREVADGTLSDQVFADYLRLEEEFVQTAARLHGLAVWDAPSWPAAVHNGRAVYTLVTEQTEYFRAARAGWPVPARARGPATASELSEFALASARAGGYPAIMTVLFAAETLYLTWCTRALAGGSVPAGPIGDWVAMHAGEPFRAGVAALAEQVDRIPTDQVDDAQLGAWFTGMLDAEIRFHDAAFG